MKRPTENDRIAYLTALCKTVPYSIVEPVLADPVEASVLDRETFDGTVLFADLVGFTALCEDLARAGPTGLSRLTHALNSLFARILDEVVFPYAGYVIQFGGDSITAVFRGAEHELRAGRAALEMQALMKADLSHILDEERRALLLRVGIAAGPIRLTIMGDAAQRQVVVAGDAAHRTVECQQRADPGQVIADAAVAAALKDRALLSPLDAQCHVLEAITADVPRAPIAELGDRVRSRVEEKIKLLEPFVPPTLAARLKTTPTGWRVDGELRDVAVLFCEILGLDKREGRPELSVNMSRSFLRAFRKYGGMTAKVDLCQEGHKVMVVFGLQMPSENDPERALLAALEATARMRSFTASVMETPVIMKIGASAGQVYFGAFGSDYRHDLTIVGDAVNTAARAAAAAQPFEVVATAALMERCPREFEHSERQPIAVKGKREPLTLHVVHAAREGHAHYVRTRQRARSYAGRDQHVARLEAVVAQARAGQGALLGLCGEAGTGKSALLSSLIDSFTSKGGVGMLGRCRFATRSEPLAPIVAMFTSFLGLATNDSSPTRLSRIRAGLQPFNLESGGADLIPLLEPAIRPDGTRESLDLADTHLRERILASMERFLEVRMREEPILYVMEDVQHADSLTIELMLRCSEVARRGPGLFVVTYRPDPVVGSLRRAVHEELALGALSQDDAVALANKELGSVSVDDRLARFLMARTAGNPGHLVDVLRFLKERSLVSVRAGVATAPLDTSLLEDLVPVSRAHVTLARLDGLGEVERRLLRAASAIGFKFPRDVLESVTRGDVDASLVDAAVKNLEGERVIAPELGEQRGYSFRDDVTRTVAYGTIPEAQRREVHRRIADALSALPDNEPARSPAVLAIHLERAGEAARAASEYAKAAYLALAGSLDAEVVQLVDRWQRLTQALPEPERPSKAVCARLHLARVVAHGRMGAFAEALRAGRALITELGADLDDDGRRVAERWIGEALLWRREPARAREWLGRVVDGGDPALAFDAALLVARSWEIANDAAAAERWVARAQALAGGDASRALRVDLMRAHLLSSGRLEEARALYLGVQGRARAQHRLRLDAEATNGLAYADMLLGHLPEAERSFDEAVVRFRALGAWADVANALANRGQTMLWAARADDARAALEQALTLAVEVGAEMVVAEVKVHLGCATALTADLARGLAMLEEGEQLCREGELAEPLSCAAVHRLRIAAASGGQAALAEARARLPGVAVWPLHRDAIAEIERRLGAG